MSVSEDLLVPISATKPSGDSLRYARTYDDIKEARRKEDTIHQGDWQRPLKEANYPLVIKLSTEALKRSSKDLWLAAWLTEALAYTKGLSGLVDGLNLLVGMVDQFWDTLYPEIDEGDLGLRVAPLSWVGEFRDLQVAVRSIPLTKNRLDWFKYTESR